MKPGVKKLIGGSVLCIGGAILVPILIVVPLMLDKSKDKPFWAPGEARVEAKEPGKYYLWHHYQTVFEGKTVHQPEAMPDGMEISIRDASGATLPFVANTSISSNVGSSAKRSVGYVEIADAGMVDVVIDGTIDTPRVMSFSPTKIWRILGAVMVGVVLSGIVCLAGGVLIIWGIVQLSTVKNIPPEPTTEMT